MVAGILEKSKRLRWILCFAILRNSCFQAAWGCGTERDEGAKKSRPNIANQLTSGVLEKKTEAPARTSLSSGATYDAYSGITFKVPRQFKGLFRPAARGTGCHTFIPAPRFHSASWVYLEDAGRRRLAVEAGEAG